MSTTPRKCRKVENYDHVNKTQKGDIDKIVIIYINN